VWNLWQYVEDQKQGVNIQPAPPAVEPNNGGDEGFRESMEIIENGDTISPPYVHHDDRRDIQPTSVINDEREDKVQFPAAVDERDDVMQTPSPVPMDNMLTDYMDDNDNNVSHYSITEEYSHEVITDAQHPQESLQDHREYENNQYEIEMHARDNNDLTDSPTSRAYIASLTLEERQERLRSLGDNVDPQFLVRNKIFVPGELRPKLKKGNSRGGMYRYETLRSLNDSLMAQISRDATKKKVPMASLRTEKNCYGIIDEICLVNIFQ